MSKYKGRIQEDTDLVNKKYVDDMMKAAKLAAYPIGSVIYWDVPPHYTNTDEPSSPVVNDIWCDISAGLPGVYKIYNGTTWDAYDFPDLSAADKVAAYFGGGTWVQVKDKFILACGDTYATGRDGGSSSVTLTSKQSGLPEHSHISAEYQSYNIATSGSSTKRTGPFGVGSGHTGAISTALNSAQDATSAHNNMPPYRTLYCWQRLK